MADSGGRDEKAERTGPLQVDIQVRLTCPPGNHTP